MQKQQITTGTPIPPEWYNAMQTPTYEGTDEDVGHLPLPPNYGEKIQYFKSQSGSVDLSTATGGVVVVLHEGSTTSLQKETLTVTGVSGATAYAIWVIPTGTDYELDVVLPLNSQANTTITLHAGCAGLFAWFNYGSAMNWRGFELPRKDLKAYFKAIDADGRIKAGTQTTEPNFPSNVNEVPSFNGGFFGQGVDEESSNWFHISERGIFISKIVQSNTAARFLLHIEDKGWVVRGLKSINSDSGSIGTISGTTLSYDKISSKIQKKIIAIPQSLTTNDLKDSLGNYFEAYGSESRDIFRIPASYEHGGPGRVGMSMTFSMTGYNAEIGEIITIHNIGSDELTINFNSNSVTIEPGFCKQFEALPGNLWSCFA